MTSDVIEFVLVGPNRFDSLEEESFPDTRHAKETHLQVCILTTVNEKDAVLFGGDRRAYLPVLSPGIPYLYNLKSFIAFVAFFSSCERS